MRVLQVNAVSGFGSTGRICAEINEFLDRNGHEGYLAYSVGAPCPEGYRINSQFDSKLHCVLSFLSGLQGYWSIGATKSFIEYIDTLKPDIVHLHNLHSNYVNLRLLLTYMAKRKIPTVLTLHDCWPFTGRCCYYTSERCSKWQTECSDCPRIKQDNRSLLLDRSTKMYRDKRRWLGNIPVLAVVGVSDWITNEARRSFLATAHIIKRIYNWIDLDKFQPINADKIRKKLGAEQKFVILGVASKWTDRGRNSTNDKGLWKFIELAGLLDDDMLIVLVGNIPSHINLPHNVRSVGCIHDVEDLVMYYSMADVFVNLSVEESFGLVTAEALACGTPAVVMNSTANPELIKSGCGYIVRENDLHGSLECIKEVKLRGKAYFSLSCISHAKASFRKDDRIGEYMALYNQLLKEKVDL